jgi:hypothetical protein
MFASLIFPTPLPSLCAASRISVLALLGFVLWSVYRAMCLKPGCRTWWTAVSWAEAFASRSATPSRNLAALPWTLPHHQYLPRSALKHTLPLRHPISVTSWSFHILRFVAAYLGMIMPLLVYLQSRLAIIFHCANASIPCELKPSKCLMSSSPLSACELVSLRS